MVVCKFFVEGYCKFGVRCKFDHVDPYRGGYNSPRSADYSSERSQGTGTSILKAATSTFGSQDYSQSPQQHSFSQHSFSQSPQHSFNQTPLPPPSHGFGTPPQQSSFAQKSPGLKYNVQEIMQIVVRDIAQLEKGGQWQLSCYSPLKELSNIPGLDDYSPEELRWESYKALQNGSLPLCQVIVQQLYGNVAKMNNDLKRKDCGYSIIDRWLRDSDQQRMQNREQPVSAFTPPLGGSSVSGTSFGSPFFSSSESQAQPQPVPSSFSFSLAQQQPLTNTQPFQQNTSLFSSNPSSPSVFSSNQMTSAFASRNTSPLSPSPAPAVDSQVYSVNEALTETELAAFQADRFVLGSIPTKPPPRVLCNL